MYMVPKYAERVRGRTPKCVCSKGGCVDLVQCFGSKYVQGVQNRKNSAYALNWKPLIARPNLLEQKDLNMCSNSSVELDPPCQAMM